eukprot:6061661-Pyramimonas_sp.AAC.1
MGRSWRMLLPGSAQPRLGRASAFSRQPASRLLVDGAPRARTRLPGPTSRPSIEGITPSTHSLALSSALNLERKISALSK